MRRFVCMLFLTAVICLTTADDDDKLDPGVNKEDQGFGGEQGKTEDLSTLSAPESKLPSEPEDGGMISSIPSSGLSPGTREISGSIKKTPLDTPTFTGDASRVHMLPGPPGARPREPVIPHGIQVGTDGPEGSTLKPPVSGPEKRQPLPPTAPPQSPDTFIQEERCSQSLEAGPCQDYVSKWYYEATNQTCVQFWFGGCQGNDNQFETEMSCKKACVKV